VQKKYQNSVRSLLSDSKDRVDLLSRIFMALGRADSYMRLDTDRWGKIAKLVAENVDDADYMAALNRVYFDNKALLGASESFFKRCMTDVLVAGRAGPSGRPDRQRPFHGQHTEEKIRMLESGGQFE
jgi:hypothetical protein